MPTRQFLAKLHRRLFILLIFFLPIQLGRHFWPSWSYVLGLRVDYLSPTLYLTDLLVMAILGAWAIEKGRDQKLRLKNSLFLFATLVFLFANCLLAQNQGAAFYQLVKMVEFVLLGFYVAKNRHALSVARNLLPWPVIYSSLIALGQFFKQASLGGLFWWLGERTFTSITPAIAKAVVDGRLVMRPYATFPHPNVLAGFILVVLVLTNVNDQIPRAKKIWRWLALILGGAAILVTFSRAVWIVAAIVVIGLVTRWLKKQRAWVLVFGGLLLLVVVYFSWRLSTQEALGYRIQLTKAAGLMFQTAPLVGVGLNNFVVRLPELWPQQTIYWLQPVHNLFLLVVAEAGLVGLFIVLWLLYLTLAKLYREKNILVFSSLLVILLLGLVDHYWLTLQQSQLLLVIVLGLGWREKRTVLQ